MNKGTGFWTKENCDRLRTWWEISGYTCGRIVAEYGSFGYVVTTNAVIGKVHRMKLKPPEWKAEKVRKRCSEIIKARNRMAPPERQVIIMGKKYNPRKPTVKVSLTHDKPDENQATLLKHSKDGYCKAIIGYVGGKLEDAVYCHVKVAIVKDKYGHDMDSSWCPYHRSIYIVESKPSKNQSYRQGNRR